VRGERHEDKIRFKGKDVERVFQIDNLLDNVQRSDSGYSKEIDYEILFVIAPQIEGQLQTERRDAPPILELREEEKFTDDAGNVYEVEVRGERH